MGKREWKILKIGFGRVRRKRRAEKNSLSVETYRINWRRFKFLNHIEEMPGLIQENR